MESVLFASFPSPLGLWRYLDWVMTLAHVSFLSMEATPTKESPSVSAWVSVKYTFLPR